MNFVSAFAVDFGRSWLALTYPETALLVVAIAPVLLLLLLGRRLLLLAILFAEAAMTIALLRVGMTPHIIAAFLIAGNAVLTAILLTLVDRRTAGLQARLSSAEEAIRELQTVEERRRAAMARDVVHQFPGPQKGRSSSDMTDHASHG